MALFEHIIMLRQDLSSSDLEDAIKVHEQTLGELKEMLFIKKAGVKKSCISNKRK